MIFIGGKLNGQMIDLPDDLNCYDVPANKKGQNKGKLFKIRYNRIKFIIDNVPISAMVVNELEAKGAARLMRVHLQNNDKFIASLKH